MATGAYFCSSAPRRTPPLRGICANEQGALHWKLNFVYVHHTHAHDGGRRGGQDWTGGIRVEKFSEEEWLVVGARTDATATTSLRLHLPPPPNSNRSPLPSRTHHRRSFASAAAATRANRQLAAGAWRGCWERGCAALSWAGTGGWQRPAMAASSAHSARA